MQTKVIEISVEGDVGTGKSHVLASIEQGLKAAYGQSVQVVSRDLFEERGLVGSDEEMTRPNLNNTVFVLRETSPNARGDNRLAELEYQPTPVVAPIRNWKDGFLHVVDSTYIVLSPDAVMNAIDHAVEELGFGNWANVSDVVQSALPSGFPSVISLVYSVGHSGGMARAVLEDIKHKAYPQFFADLTGQPCSGIEPRAPMELKRDSVQLC